MSRFVQTARSGFVQAARSLLAVVFIMLCSLNLAWAAVNANTASVDELQTVRGIGPAIAQRIVDERAKGPFKSLDDLQSRVKGVGHASVKKMAAAGLTTGSASTRASRAPNAARDTSSRDTASRDTASRDSSASDAASRNTAGKPVPKSNAPSSTPPTSDSGKTPRKPSEAAAEPPKASPRASDQAAAPSAKPGQ
jgi:competence protein ComEA